MTRYEFALFLHLVGALAFGAGAFMSLVSLWALRRAQRVEQARLVLSMFSFAGPVLGHRHVGEHPRWILYDERCVGLGYGLD